MHMHNYMVNTSKVIEQLKSHGCREAFISPHRTCFNLFYKFASENNITNFTEKIVEDWLMEIRPTLNSLYQTLFKTGMRRLFDVYETGTIRQSHLPSPSNYNSLIPSLKKELDEYLDYRRSIGSFYPALKQNNARFMFYIQNNGCHSMKDLNYDVVLQFYKADDHVSDNSKSQCTGHIMHMLRYLSDVGIISKGIPFFLSEINKNTIVFDTDLTDDEWKCIKEISQDDLDFPASNVFESVTDYVNILDRHGYSKSTKLISGKAIMYLATFLDMYQLEYHPEIAATWFNAYQRISNKSSLVVERKALSTYREYTQIGNIIPGKMDWYKPTGLDQLPSWCRKEILSFLDIQKREGKAKSTIKMSNACCVRFCEYLIANGISRFEDITADDLVNFALTDPHSTKEGKAAYARRIRQFIEYLEDENIIKNKTFHLSLPICSAPFERVVTTITKDEERIIEQFCNEAKTPIEFRTAAIAMISLKMGLRSTDIVNIKFTDINLSTQSLKVIQQKTLVEIELYIPNEVLKTIYMYVKHGRPKESKSKYIFVSHKIPYEKPAKSICTDHLGKIDFDNTGGLHKLRRTYSTNVLRRGNPIDMVVSSVGHTTPGTIHKYLSLDEERMRLCAIPLSAIPSKGGDVNE